jgi:hypothetical protein
MGMRHVVPVAEPEVVVKAPNLQGECEGCHRGIPHGYLAVVTAWRRVERCEYVTNKLCVMMPKTMYCRQCAPNYVTAKPTYRRKHNFSVEEIEAPALSAKDVAIRLLRAMSKETAMGSKLLAKKAELEYSDVILTILRKLKDAGKVVFEEGRWKRV